MVKSWNEKGEDYLKHGNYKKALFCFDEGLKQYPKNQKLLGNKGVALTYLKRYEEALTYFNSVLENEPNNVESLNNKGILLYKMKKKEYFKDIKESREKLKDSDREDFQEVLFDLAVIEYSEKKILEEPLECFNQVLDIEPENINALNNKGVLLANLNKNIESIKYFDKILDIDPKNPKALRNKGNVYYKINSYKEALELYSKYLKIKPKDNKVIKRKNNALIMKNIFSEGFLRCDKSKFDKLYNTDLKNNINNFLNENNRLFFYPGTASDIFVPLKYLYDITDKFFFADNDEMEKFSDEIKHKNFIQLLEKKGFNVVDIEHKKNELSFTKCELLFKGKKIVFKYFHEKWQDVLKYIKEKGMKISFLYLSGAGGEGGSLFSDDAMYEKGPEHDLLLSVLDDKIIIFDLDVNPKKISNCTVKQTKDNIKEIIIEDTTIKAC